MLAQVSYAINQLTPGLYQIAPAMVGVRYAVIAFLLGMSANGTWKFTDDSGDLSTPVIMQANLGPITYSAEGIPLVVTHEGNALNLVTTQGSMRGVVVCQKQGTGN